ncbi:hypothetical protein Tco_0457072, partial [Tanacetum coccineum]
MFDLDLLTPSMNYIPVKKENYADSKEQHNAAEVLVAISRPRGLSIPGPIQSQPQQTSVQLKLWTLKNNIMLLKFLLLSLDQED